MRLLLPLACALLSFKAAPAHAYEFSDQLEVYGYFQGWLTAYEEAEEYQDLVQQPSGDKATRSTSGFSVNRARLGLKARALEGLLGMDFQLKLEPPIEVLDLLVKVSPWDWLTVQFGQFKVPSTAENLTDNRDLDFVLRSDIASALADYSLSRTTYASSLFYGNKSQLRDLGLGLKLNIPLPDRSLRIFGMVGNGLGANLFIGGLTKKEYVLTNKLQFFYALRVELEAWPDWVTIGGHASYNRHDNIVFNSGRVVLDLDRRSASGDVSLSIPGTGARCAGMYGAGWILDDWDNNGKDDLVYSGYEGRLLWELNPLLIHLTQSAIWSDHRIELGAHYEDYITESDESGEPSHRHTWTFGLTYAYRRYIKVQLDAMLHRAKVPYERDLDDDAVILSLQAAL